MKNILSSLAHTPAIAAVYDTIRTAKHCGISGCSPAFIPALSAGIVDATNRPLLLIGHAPDDAEHLYAQLPAYLSDDITLFSAHAWEGDDTLLNVSVARERVSTLSTVRNGTARIVVAPCQALLHPLPPPQEFDAHALKLEVGGTYDLHALMVTLVTRGYERTDMVSFHGEFSARGGILDIYLITEDTPFRIEFFGDEITDIRPFDVHTQRSRTSEARESLMIPAARESSLQTDTVTTLLDYYTQPPIILWHEYARAVRSITTWIADDALRETAGARFDTIQRASAALPVVYAQELSTDAPDAINDAHYTLDCRAFSLSPAATAAERDTTLKPYQHVMRGLADSLATWRDEDYAVHLVCASDAEMNRLRELLDKETDLPHDAYALHVAPVYHSWILPESRLAVVTEDDIFQRVYTRRARRKKSRDIATQPIDNIATIEEGEYVVHLTHGIGQFDGIRHVTLEDITREMIVIRYAEDALLYVPLTQAHLIERYITPGETAPTLDTLGSGRWSARRRRVERAVLDLAAELLERQATRATREGTAFGGDTEWQTAFEKAFPYALTLDQAKALRDTKSDMERPAPMDRLICGDVGFGKTEIAVRAAFKCAMDGKQTAVLVPTTVLALQHWHTFTERMAEYPVRIEMLSRFVPAPQQKNIVHDLAGGHVDIIIGTHRLLSREVAFKDVGLIIVDEEQRFGVRHKEKLKNFCTTADVLTLSATPIPRTLYQALTQLRDMSTILTPPEERMPVKTVLIKNDEKLIREAILRECARNGQVFFVHNRVETIERVRAQWQERIPSARFAVAHGQMDEDELAEIMEQFARRAYDVLICTTIIESGLDFPHANTIIIDRADRFGLADLYQLRGRVGRSHTQAYAYLIVPGNVASHRAARQRLKAILENTALGSGYAIAMKDLEIRGGGNVLGAQQSGHIASIGFSLYCKLLERAINLVKNEKVRNRIEAARAAQAAADAASGEEDGAPKKLRVDWRKDIPVWRPPGTDIELHLPFSGTLPEEYIASAAIRLDIFRRIGTARKVSVLTRIEEEMRDRFGPLPEEAVCALRIAEICIHARDRGVTSIETRDNKIILRRKGTIISDAGPFPTINPDDQSAAITIILAYLSRIRVRYARGK